MLFPVILVLHLILAYLATAVRAAPPPPRTKPREEFSKCIEGRPDEKKGWHPVGNCDLKPNNVYFCNAGATLVHKQSQITVRAKGTPTTLVIGCDNKVFFLYCPAWEGGKFPFPECKTALQSVTNVQNDP
ncbi:hypothetical protein EG328_001497 [Venturia inaequalis]|uniref:Secreted protein n=1 Tax=Venturia inaequalis TaxID=5025 RepID=A0A8H3Z057_VENIN|nr:hypothetical protein EG328_001497 [Venturia inaequalis]KAE9993476.1 hypothetical protein EG327_004960 [Venturia inaequalis]